jgi:hypothetical protein
MGQHWPNGYSADVEIYLLIAGERIDVAQVWDGSLILRRSQTIAPSTEATLVLKIDGQEKQEQIFLSEGARSCEEPVPYF